MPLRNRLPLIIGVVLGLLTIGMVKLYIQQRESQLRRELLKGQEPVPVLIAAKDIPADTVLRDDMLFLENRPALAVQPHAVMDPGAALGMVTMAPIYAGEQVSDSKLTRPDTAAALSMKTPPGKRAVTMSVDSISGVGGLVKPGDFVDLMGTFQLPGPPGGEKATATVTLLQRVEVLAVGKNFSMAGEEEDPNAGMSDNVTLALAPQEAQLLLFARAAQAQIQLSLRARNDTTQLTDLEPTTSDTLLGVILGPKLLEMAQQAPKEPVHKPEKKVEVYRGLQREIVALQEKAD